MKTTQFFFSFLKLALCYAVLFDCLLHIFDLLQTDYFTTLFKLTVNVWFSTKLLILLLQEAFDTTWIHDFVTHLQILKFISIFLMVLVTAIQMFTVPYSFVWGIILVIACVWKLWLSLTWDLEPYPAES